MTASTFTKTSPPASGVSLTPIDTTVLKLVRGGTLPSVGALLRNGVSFSMIDTRPLRWHQGVGGGGGGTTVTLNPTDTDPAVTLSNGNLTALGTTGSPRQTRSTVTKQASSGYVEATVLALSANDAAIGIEDPTHPTSVWIGWDQTKAAEYRTNGSIVGTNNSTSGVATLAVNDKVGLHWKADGSVDFYKNSSLVASRTDTPGAGALFAVQVNNGDSWAINFGATAMVGLPVGATSWDGSKTNTGLFGGHPTLALERTSSGNTLSNNNLTATWVSSWGLACPAPSVGGLSGKKYWEVTMISGAGTSMVGVVSADLGFQNVVLNTQDGHRVGWRSGNVWMGAGVPAAPAMANGDVLGIAYDSATRKVWFRNASGWINSGDPVAGTNGFQLTLGTTPDIPALGFDSATSVMTVNFGASAFAYTPPTGFTAL